MTRKVLGQPRPSPAHNGKDSKTRPCPIPRLIPRGPGCQEAALGGSLGAPGQTSEGPGIREWKAQGRPEPGVRVSRLGSPPYLHRTQEEPPDSADEGQRCWGGQRSGTEDQASGTSLPHPPTLNLLMGTKSNLMRGWRGGGLREPGNQAERLLGAESQVQAQLQVWRAGVRVLRDTWDQEVGASGCHTPVSPPLSPHQCSGTCRAPGPPG